MKSLLIVDDEIELTELISFFFEDLGFTVFTANSGERARQIIANQHIDCIISDVCMPKESGVDMLLKMRSQQHYAPVIFITGFSKNHDLRLQGLEGVVVLEKPVKFPVLEKAVRQATGLDVSQSA